MKLKRIAAAVLLIFAAATVADAQINLKGLKEKAQNAAKSAVGKAVGNTGSTATKPSAGDLVGKVASKVLSLIHI